MSDMTIDERLEFLLQSTESLHSTTAQQGVQIGDLKAVVEKHEKRWEMLRRGLAGALQEALGPEDEEAGEGG